MSYACPACNNEGTQRVSMAYQSGVSVINTTSVGAATGIGSGPTMVGIGKTHGTSQTETARSLAPPEKLSYPKAFLGWLFSSKGWLPFTGIASLYQTFRDAHNYNNHEYSATVVPWLITTLSATCKTVNVTFSSPVV